MHGRIARAITGRDLALLIVQRLTDANFNVEMELERLFWCEGNNWYASIGRLNFQTRRSMMGTLEAMCAHPEGIDQ